MSADMFSTKTSTIQKNFESPHSRIPVPSSPVPLRRSASVRIKGEKDTTTPQFSRASNFHLRTSREINHQSSKFNKQQDELQSRGAFLKRGNSFMERGERRTNTGTGHGVRNTAVGQRPQNVITEVRNTGALTRATTPLSPPRNRSLSLSLSTTRLSVPKSPAAVSSSPKTPPTSPEGRYRSTSTNYLDWDTESITSATSGISVASCDHASVARNGTTFSGRSMKYVVHCNQHAGATGEDYLTPTQRAHRQVKRLKSLLQQAQKDLEQKDSDIVKLTKEVVELRLYKAALSSPEDKSNSSDAITVRENNTDEQSTPDGDLVDAVAIGNHLGEMTSSYADSGHFEDCTNSSVHSKDSVHLCEDLSQSPYRSKSAVETADKSISVNLGPRDYDSEHHKLVAEYERRLQELVRTHEEESHQLKQKHNDKVDELLQRLTEINTRYWQLVPDLESAKERIKELEQQLEDACKKLQEQENKDKQTYLQMYTQGQEAAKMEREKQVMELAHQNPSRISVPELLQQLQVTQTELENIKDLEYSSSSNNLQPLLSAKEAVSLWVLGARKAMYRQLMEAKNSKNKIDPEITLQFLKSAIYYFLTDKENNQGHLRAIQSILGFTPNEISNINKARLN